MSPGRLRMPETAGAIILAEVSRFGRKHMETGGFLLTSRKSHRVVAVAAAGKKGISRGPFQFRISGEAVDVIFTHAEENGFHIPVQWHSHGRDCELSETDRRHGFAVEGFVSTVIPDFRHPPRHPADWGWWTFSNAEWCGSESPMPAEGQVDLITFDEDGVR